MQGRFEVMGSGFESGRRKETPLPGRAAGKRGWSASWKRTSGARWNTGWSCLGGNGNTGRVICVLNEKGTLRYSGILKEINGLRFLPPR